MDTPKSKDGPKAWKDMVQLNVMPELHPKLEDNGKYTLLVVSYNLDLQERRALCTFVRGSTVQLVFGELEEASVNEGPIICTLQGSRLSCDADSVPINCNQGYKARVLEDGYHSHVLLLFKYLTEDDRQERAE
jgi:hypothetical protein